MNSEVKGFTPEVGRQEPDLRPVSEHVDGLPDNMLVQPLELKPFSIKPTDLLSGDAVSALLAEINGESVLNDLTLGSETTVKPLEEKPFSITATDLLSGDAVSRALADMAKELDDNHTLAPMLRDREDTRRNAAYENSNRPTFRSRLGGVALGAAMIATSLFTVSAVIARPDRPSVAEVTELADKGANIDSDTQADSISIDQPGVNAVSTTEVTQPWKPAIGEQSAILQFDVSMCNEVVSIREAPEEYIGLDGANESILNTLELDDTPQLGCAEGTRHVEEMRAQGKKNRTREDPTRFVISRDSPELPRYPDGSRPTNSGELLPVAQRSMASNMLGDKGIVYIDGHRSTESAPFSLLDNQKPGDDILGLRGDGLVFKYVVDHVESVSVEGYQQKIIDITSQITARTGNESILIISACDPYASKTHRIVSFAILAKA